MDHTKVDAALAAALSEPTSGSEPSLAVSVRTRLPLDAVQQAELRTLGVHGVEPGRTVFSATLSRQALATLTEKPWVQRLSLAQRLKPLS
ncbi:MAG TPA: hypothetical protein VG013_12800 [Gemmataceae bacterium]|nr:hypothetical protein [Gemmataceae bacterium]